MTRASGKFTVVGGGEAPVSDLEGVRTTRVEGRQRFEGDLEGDGSVEWVMCYLPDRSAGFAGFQRVEGSLGGRTGSFVMESTGHHDGSASTGGWRILPGSGSGELAGIRGTGRFDAPGGQVVAYELDFTLD
jgi:hypothetical protein